MTGPVGPLAAAADTATDRCGPLDVADAGRIPTDELAEAELAVIRRAALASTAYDGAPGTVTGTVAFGTVTVAKLQRRTHERIGTIRRLEWLRQHAGIPAPQLLDHGTVPTGRRDGWWAILSYAAGGSAASPTPGQQRALGAALRAWHESGVTGGLRLDDPGGLGVLLGTPREFVPAGYPELAERYAAACAGQPVTPIHGDAAVCHNTLFAGDDLAALIDSGAVEHGPPMLDLAWALAVDLPHGAAADPLLDGYGRDAVSRDALAALLPLLMVRRLVDVRRIGAAAVGADWLIGWLRAYSPDLLALVAGELGV
ncbi:MAG: phosphotransferase [Micromonosporaceae bacterium]